MFKNTRTALTLKRHKKSRVADKYLRSLMINYNQYYLTDEEHREILQAIHDSKIVKDPRIRLMELLVYHYMILREGEESEEHEDNVESAVKVLQKYHALVLLDAYIEMMTKVRVKKLYRFKGSRYVFGNTLDKYNMIPTRNDLDVSEERLY